MSAYQATFMYLPFFLTLSYYPLFPPTVVCTLFDFFGSAGVAARYVEDNVGGGAGNECLMRKKTVGSSPHELIGMRTISSF